MFRNFDIVRVVSLPERLDRRKFIASEFRKFGLIGQNESLASSDARVAFFDAYRVPEAGLFRSAGSHGAYLSHLEILREAARNDQSVLILQDDCSFYDEVTSYKIPADCDVFYGGWTLDNQEDEKNLHNAHIIGAHFMGFSRKAAKLAAKYLTNLLEPSFPPDPEAVATERNFNPKQRPPIDGSLVWFRRAHPELKVIFKMLGEQRCSVTDIGDQGKLDQYPILALPVRLLREIKHRLVMYKRTRRRGQSATVTN